MKAQWHPTLICWAEIFHCYRLGVCKLDVTSDLTVEPYTLISMPWTKTVVARWQFADSTSTGKECLLFRVQSGWCNPSMGNSCLRCWWASWTKLTYERKWNRVLETMKKCPLQLQSVLLMLYFLIFDILRVFFHTSPIRGELCGRSLPHFGPLVNQSAFNQHTALSTSCSMQLVCLSVMKYIHKKAQ